MNNMNISNNLNNKNTKKIPILKLSELSLKD